MDTTVLVDMMREAVIIGGVLVAPALITALVVGVVMSLLQAVTQVQDQAISFVPKLIVVAAVVLVMVPWMTEYFVAYAREAILRIPESFHGG